MGGMEAWSEPSFRSRDDVSSLKTRTRENQTMAERQPTFRAASRFVSAAGLRESGARVLMRWAKQVAER
jgi:hypothetical protein